MNIFDIILKKCMGCRKGECLLILCDEKRKVLAEKFFRAAQGSGSEAIFMLMREREAHGEEPPAAAAAALKNADVAVLLTSKSLSHTKARKAACRESGTRIASLPGVTEEMLKRSIPIDYDLMRRKARRLSGILTKARKIDIHTDRGTSLTMSVSGRRGFADDGLYRKRGAFGNLPAGEVCIAPLEGTANGRLVVDGSMPLTGRLKRPIEIMIKDGYARNIPVAKMAPLVRSLGKRALNVAELGIGLNPRARVTGNVLEDEKAAGTAHVALGNNVSFGGIVSCPSHLDFVLFDPVITIDGVRLRF